jgi:4a-hydroxytetrahydrobiopterin dehydratase
MQSRLAKKKCVPCRVGAEPLKGESIKQYLAELDDSWIVEEEKRLVREVAFKDFKEAVAFVNQVAEVAEAEGHHPNICIHDYKKVTLRLYTHKIGGLHENDFVLGYKIDRILRGD